MNNTYTITLTAGEALFLWFLRNGKTIAQLARAIGQPRQRTSDILRGYAVPTEACKKNIYKYTNWICETMWGVDWPIVVTPGEHLITLIRRKGWTIKQFCDRAKMNDTRMSGIIRSHITPTALEQTAIGKIFKELRGKWNAPK